MNRIAVLAAAFCGGAFGATLVLFKIDPDDFVALDSLATKVVAPFQFFTPSEFFIALTTLGGLPAVALTCVLVAVFLRSEKKLLVRLILALGTSGLLVMLVKNSIGRIRPDGLPWLAQLHSY